MPPAAPDPFDLLGLPATFDLTREQIQRAYLARAGQAHPDAKQESDRHASEAGSADLNRAARVLRDPESRAAALLHRLGGPGKEVDKSLPEGFLQAIMGTRLEIEDSLHDPSARARWDAWARDQREQYAARCSTLFKGLSTPPNDAQLRDIRATLNAWRYIERLIEQLDPAYDPARADFDRP